MPGQQVFISPENNIITVDGITASPNASNKQPRVIPVNKDGLGGIFAAGDVTNTPFKQAIIAAGDGARAALQVYSYITGNMVIGDWH